MKERESQVGDLTENEIGYPNPRNLNPVSKSRKEKES